MIRFLAVGVLSLCAVMPALAGAPALHPGKYEGLMPEIATGLDLTQTANKK